MIRKIIKITTLWLFGFNCLLAGENKQSNTEVTLIEQMKLIVGEWQSVNIEGEGLDGYVINLQFSSTGNVTTIIVTNEPGEEIEEIQNSTTKYAVGINKLFFWSYDVDPEIISRIPGKHRIFEENDYILSKDKLKTISEDGKRTIIFKKVL